jgi:hypothetical protein
MQTQTNLENVLKNNVLELNNAEELISSYRSMDTDTKKNADNLFYSMCGISLGSLITDHESRKIQ